jgi:hypothetical protein
MEISMIYIITKNDIEMYRTCNLELAYNFFDILINMSGPGDIIDIKHLEPQDDVLIINKEVKLDENK